MLRFTWLYATAWIRGLRYRWPEPVPIPDSYSGVSCGMVGWRDCWGMYTVDRLPPDEYGWTGKRWEPWAFRRTTIAGARWSATFRVPKTAEEIEYDRLSMEHFVKMGEAHYAEEQFAREALGRPLGYGEYVHHINGDPYDNRPENLRVVSRRENRAPEF